MLRTLDMMQSLPHEEVWYCRYGETRAKPTDIWGTFPESFEVRKCRNGGWGKTTIDGKVWIVDENSEPCHEYAQRGSKTAGVQGQKNAVERGMIPVQLTSELLQSILEDQGE